MVTKKKSADNERELRHVCVRVSVFLFWCVCVCVCKVGQLQEITF